jgi:hypothetical protein
MISGELMYQLGQDGRLCLSHFYEKIPASIREEIIAYTHENKMRMKRNQEYTFDYFKNADATHTAVLKIKDGVRPENIIEIKINVPTRTDALRATKRWKQSAPEIFETIWETLVEKDSGTNDSETAQNAEIKNGENKNEK